MNQPSIIVRLCGSLGMAIPLTLTGLWLIYGWTQGSDSVWHAMIGCFITVKTLACIKQLNRYNAWRKQWDAFGTFGKAPQQKKPVRPWRAISIVAPLLFVGIIVLGPQVAADNPELQNLLMGLWLLCGLFLAARSVIGVRKLIMRPRAKGYVSAKPEDHVVTCTLGGTLDSPSRAQATANLPDYAARILSRGGT
jgi:hypothetical protein